MTTQTPEAQPTTRRRATRRVAAFAALAAVVVMALGACSPEEDRGVQLVNDSRAAAGLPGLALNVDLYLKAQGWSNQLANSQSLYHSNLPDGNGYNWCRLGENVGYGGTPQIIERAYMASPGHRRNILDPHWDSAGVGYRRAGSRIYTVQVFVKLC